MRERLVAPYWGLRTRADPGADPVLRAAIFADRMPPRAFYFGRTAAALHELPLPKRFAAETALHVGVHAGDRRVDALGIVGHHVRIGSDDVVTHRSLRMTSVARTWCDLASSQLTLAELVAAGDRALWHRHATSTRDEIGACIRSYEGRRGALLMRQAFSLLTNKADSAPESEVRVAIISAGFPPPEVNVEIRLSTGETLHPDLSWPEFKIAIDYEGDHHRVERDQWHQDIQRFRAFNDAAWRIYRATAEDYRDPQRILGWLARNLPPSAGPGR
jgi:hypothetical protein